MLRNGRPAGQSRSSALWGTGNSDDSRSNALWGKGGRGLVTMMAAVLVLGILSIVIGCAGWILGIIAWVMANGDLAEMASGQMDPSGRGLTQAGKVLGMVSVILHLAALAIWVILLILGGGIAVWGASTGH